MTAIKSHLPAIELEHRYKTASEAIAKSHFHALWLLARGYSIDQVAGLLSFSTRWVRTLIKRYNEGGPERLGDQRAHNGTEASILTPEALAGCGAAEVAARGWRAVDGAEDRTLARRLPRAQVGARPARLGCACGDRLVDPAAASSTSESGERAGSRALKKNCSEPPPMNGASIRAPKSRSGRRMSTASA
jgi:hypothetical protein